MSTIRVLTLLAFGFFCSVTAWASCQGDMGGTFKTDQYEIVPIDGLICFFCREINHHPKDIRNFMYNWAALGRANLALPVLEDVGRDVFDYRLDADITARNVVAVYGSDTMAIPVCNHHGQCATGIIQVEHNYESVQFAMGWYLYFNTSIKRINVSVSLANGDTVAATSYTPAQLAGNRAQSGFKFPVPYNNDEDFAEES